ncbi:DUF3008 family protein [Sphingomonas sp.]|jgi:hypothetical protein|uniref:DUF3008 family protein n=1 Tax=Sphingomonas sp. TaxID=28214 RepID=UPI002DE33E24|nr:DUF3008 family protein [Sphingomonas sp.]
MSEKQLEELAHTKRKGKQEHVSLSPSLRAKRSIQVGQLDCFVASLLAMTGA